MLRQSINYTIAISVTLTSLLAMSGCAQIHDLWNGSNPAQERHLHSEQRALAHRELERRCNDASELTVSITKTGITGVLPNGQVCPHIQGDRA